MLAVVAAIGAGIIALFVAVLAIGWAFALVTANPLTWVCMGIMALMALGGR